MKRGASFFSTFLLFTLSLSLIVWLVNPNGVGQTFYSNIFSIGNFWQTTINFFSNTSNWGAIGLTVGIAAIFGGVNYASAIALAISMVGSIVLIQPLLQTMFNSSDTIVLAVVSVLLAAFQVGLFMAALIIFRGIIED